MIDDTDNGWLFFPKIIRLLLEREEKEKKSRPKCRF